MLLLMRRAGWILITLLVLVMTLFALRYVNLDLEAAADGTFLSDLYRNRATWLYIHAFAAAVALLIGPLQFFLRRLQGGRAERLLPLHRWLGRVYLLAGLIGGGAGTYLALFAYGGFAAQLGFASLGGLLIVTLVSAYVAIRQGHETLHREWTIRSFSLLFAAVTLRLLQVTYAGLGVGEAQAYAAVAWSSWVPNLVVAELIVLGLRRRAAADQASVTSAATG